MIAQLNFEMSTQMQKVALFSFGLCFGAGVGLFGARVIDAGAIGTMLAATVGSCLWAWIGYRISGEPNASLMNKLAGMVLMPLALPGIVLGLLLVFGIALAVLPPIGVVQFHVQEGRLRRRMKAKGRFVSMRDVRRFLEAGRGTLIAEIGLKGGCYRIWFTEEDLSEKGMLALSNDDLIALLSGEERPFNSLVVNEYLNDEKGTALLTRTPPRWATSGRLERMYPFVSVAKVVRPHAASASNDDG